MEVKISFYNNKIDQCENDQRKLYRVLNNLTHEKSAHKLPSGSTYELLQSISGYFVLKIENICKDILTSLPHHPCTSEEISAIVRSNQTIQLSSFTPASENEVETLIRNSRCTTCPLDAIPTPLLKDCLLHLLPVITRLINLSLSSTQFPSNFSHALVKPLLKKSNLDPDSLKNYRPVSNLTFLSKILEKVVANRLNHHMTEHGLHEKKCSLHTKLLIVPSLP